MYIFQEAETPQGATCNVHRLVKSEISGDGAIVTISSSTGVDSDFIVWQDQHEVPFTAFAGNYPDDVYAYLVSATGPFGGGVLIADQDELTKLKLKRKNTVNTYRDKMIAMGCTTPSGIMDTDADSLRNIMATYQAAVLSIVMQASFSVEWRLADNSTITLNAAQLIAAGNAVLARVEACYQHSWLLKADIEANDALDQTGNVDIRGGWPAV